MDSKKEKYVLGHRIKEIFEARGMKITFFADSIKRTRQNIHSIFKRKTIDTDLLMDISKVLEHDFFLELSQQLDFDSGGQTSYKKKEESETMVLESDPEHKKPLQLVINVGGDPKDNDPKTQEFLDKFAEMMKVIGHEKGSK